MEDHPLCSNRVRLLLRTSILGAKRQAFVGRMVELRKEGFEDC